MLKNPDWKKRVKPNLKQDEKNIRGFVKFFSILLLIFLSMVIIAGTIHKQYALVILGGIGFLYVFFSWLNLSPRIYNYLHQTKKIIPIGQSTDRDYILQEICKTETPYGLPVMGLYHNYILNVPAYILKEEGWIIFFYIRNGDFIIQYKPTKNFNGSRETLRSKRIVSSFHNDLVRMFNFVINMQRRPFKNELEYIFKNYNKVINR